MLNKQVAQKCLCVFCTWLWLEDLGALLQKGNKQTKQSRANSA